LPKSAEDPTKIEEEIDKRISDHNADPDAHGLSGMALYAHRTGDILDHVEEAVKRYHLAKEAVVNLGVATRVVATSTSASKKAANYVCDGVSDQEEINAAINDLPAEGGTVFLLEGTYVIDGSIVIQKNNVTLEGCGPNTIIKVVDNVPGSGDFYAIDCGLWAGRLLNTCIKNISFDGNRANNTRFIDLIYMHYTAQSEIRNCWFKESTFRAISISDSDYCNIVNNHFSEYARGVSLWINTFYNNVSGNIFESPGGGGIDFDGGSTRTAKYNRAIGNNIEHGTITAFSGHNVIIGNTVKYGKIRICQQYNIVANNIIFDASEYGLYIMGSHHIISGNIILNSNYYGVVLEADYDMEGVILADNYIEGSGRAGGLDPDREINFANILIYSFEDTYYVRRCHLTGNKLRAGTNPNKPYYAITIHGSRCENTSILNNDLYDDGYVAGIVNDGGTNTDFAHNFGY